MVATVVLVVIISLVTTYCWLTVRAKIMQLRHFEEDFMFFTFKVIRTKEVLEENIILRIVAK